MVTVYFKIQPIHLCANVEDGYDFRHCRPHQGIETRDRLIFFVFMVSEFIMSSRTGQLSGKIKLI